MNNLLTRAISLVLAVFVFCGCSKDNVSELPELATKGYGMNFDSLRAGDKFYFQLFKGENAYSNANKNFNYIEDTLILEVLERDRNRVTIAEKLSPGSAVHTSNEDYYHLLNCKDSIFVNQWKLEDYRLRIAKRGGWVRSHLLFNIDGRLNFPTRWEKDEMETITMAGWKLSTGYNESRSYFKVPELYIQGELYTNQIAFQDNTGLSRDLSGYTIIYSREHGIIKAYWNYFWAEQGYGWDRITLN